MLVASDLSVTPPGASTPAVEHIDLQVGRGEWVAISGPNGGGKTSLLLGLAGLWPARGTLELEGRPFGPSGRERRRVGVVLQDPSSQILQPSVADEIALAPRNLGAPEGRWRAAAAALSGALDLDQDLDRDPSTLSAGRQQLTLLAAALAAEPAILFADEPTAHLDRRSRDRVRNLVAERVAAGLAVVWVTQESEERQAAHRVLNVGELVQGPEPARRGDRAEPMGDEAPMLVLRVEASNGSEGPRVTTDRPLSIVLPNRGLTSIVGRNAVGKSVLLAAAAGLDSTRQIRVEWRAQPEQAPIVALQYPELQVFQERASDEVAYAAVSRGIDRDTALGEARRCLERLELRSDFLDRSAWSLSTGEKRLLELVGALIAPSSLVILDEPTAGLDPVRKAALSRLVRERSMKSSVLVAGQDLPWVEGLGGTIVRLGD